MRFTLSHPSKIYVLPETEICTEPYSAVLCSGLGLARVVPPVTARGGLRPPLAALQWSRASPCGASCDGSVATKQRRDEDHADEIAQATRSNELREVDLPRPVRVRIEDGPEPVHCQFRRTVPGAATIRLGCLEFSKPQVDQGFEAIL